MHVLVNQSLFSKSLFLCPHTSTCGGTRKSQSCSWVLCWLAARSHQALDSLGSIHCIPLESHWSITLPDLVPVLGLRSYLRCERFHPWAAVGKTYRKAYCTFCIPLAGMESEGTSHTKLLKPSSSRAHSESTASLYQGREWVQGPWFTLQFHLRSQVRRFVLALWLIHGRHPWFVSQAIVKGLFTFDTSNCYCFLLSDRTSNFFRIQLMKSFISALTTGYYNFECFVCYLFASCSYFHQVHFSIISCLRYFKGRCLLDGRLFLDSFTFGHFVRKILIYSFELSLFIKQFGPAGKCILHSSGL